MQTFPQHKQQTLALFQTAIGLARTLKQPDIAHRLEEAAKHLTEEKLYVAVCGEFKQGKSSLINAFLNEPAALCPVDVDITTCLVSSITYGEQEKITVLLGESGKEKAHEIRREEIADYVIEHRNQRNRRQARMLAIETPNTQLQGGLVLVDTPGVGGLNVEHTDITYTFIPYADVVLFVSDALAPLSAKELDFVKMIARHERTMVHVLTKIDANDDYQTIMESNRDKLATVLGRPAADILSVPVSSRVKLLYLKSQDAEDLQDSNFAALETTLWRLLNEQRGHILLLRALGELGQGVADIRGPLQAEWETYQEHTQQELDDLEHQFQEARNRLEALLDHDASWRTQLSYGLTDIRAHIFERFQEGFVQIRRLANDYMEDVRFQASPEQIAGLLEVDIDALLSTLGQELSQQATDLHGRLEDATQLRLTPFKMGPLEYEKRQPTPLPVPIEKSRLWDKAVHATRNGLFNVTAGSVLGGLLGGAVGAGIGFLFGGVGAIPGAVIGGKIGGLLGGMRGLTRGVKQGLSQVREQDQTRAKRAISTIIGPFLDDSQRLANRSLQEATRELERAMQGELHGQLRREKKTLEDALRSLQEARKLSREQATQRAAALRGPLQQLERLYTSVEHIGEAVLAQQAPRAEKTQEEGASEDDYGDWAEA